MKALSLWQPWASAIVLGLKSIETRHWYTSVRGPIALHAAKRWGPDEREDAAMFADRFDERLRNPPLGCVLGTARIVACLPSAQLVDRVSSTEAAFGNYGPNRYGFMLEDIRPIAVPIPWKGAQGFFDIPDEILAGHAPAPAQAILL